MGINISIQQWKTFIEQKTNKKILIKIIWNETEKITLFIVPNMKINSVIFDDKDGYLLYDIDGKHVTYTIPSLVSDKSIIGGKISIEAIKNGEVTVNGVPLSKNEISLLTQNK